MIMFDSPERELARSTVALPYALVILDVHGAVLVWNPAAERLLGWSTSAAVGKSIEQVTGWGDFRDIGRELGSGATLRIVTELRRQDGTAVLAELAFGWLGNAAEEITGVLLLATDVTPSTMRRQRQSLRDDACQLFDQRRS
jgi:PAS domain S-box-containing protein